MMKQNGIPVDTGILYTAGNQPESYPVVIKSQVPVGGRGKLGGVKIAKNLAEFNKYTTQILQTEIKGYLPTNLLLEPALTIAQELYLAITINRDDEVIQFTANKNGGMEIEAMPADSFLTIPLTGEKPDFDAIGQQLADYYDLPGQTFVLQDIVENLYGIFTKNDAILIEINPLILTDDDKLVAGDAKIELDSSASFRHNWTDYEMSLPDANFVVLDEHGQVATIANGAGLAMATVDAIYSAGLKPANFLDIGGGADEKKVQEAFAKLMQFPQTKAIIINIFGGITRCDEIAKAIVSAKKSTSNLPPLYIRLSGNNYKEAKEILDANDIMLLPDLASCINSAKQEIS